MTLVERESVPGGRNGTLVQDGFRFDTGPVVFTMPGLLEDAFAAVGRAASDYVDLRPLDPGYHAHFADGSRLLIRVSGIEAMRAEIARACSEKDAAAFGPLRRPAARS